MTYKALYVLAPTCLLPRTASFLPCSMANLLLSHWFLLLTEAPFPRVANGLTPPEYSGRGSDATFLRTLCKPLTLYHRNYPAYLIIIIFIHNVYYNIIIISIIIIRYMFSREFPGPRKIPGTSRLLLSICQLTHRPPIDYFTSLSLRSLINRRGSTMPILLGSFKRQICGGKY